MSITAYVEGVGAVPLGGWVMFGPASAAVARACTFPQDNAVAGHLFHLFQTLPWAGNESIPKETWQVCQREAEALLRLRGAGMDARGVQLLQWVIDSETAEDVDE